MVSPRPALTPSLEGVHQYLSQLSATEFYGTVSLRFDKGRIVLVNVNQAIKPEHLQLSQVEPKPKSLDVQHSYN